MPYYYCLTSRSSSSISRSCSGSINSFRVDVYSFSLCQCHGCVNNRNFANRAEFVQCNSEEPCLSLTPGRGAMLPQTQRHGRPPLLFKWLLEITSAWEMNLWSKELGDTFEFLLVWQFTGNNVVNTDRWSRQTQASRDYRQTFKVNHFHGRLSHAGLITWHGKCRAARLLFSCAPR